MDKFTKSQKIHALEAVIQIEKCEKMMRGKKKCLRRCRFLDTVERLCANFASKYEIVLPKKEDLQMLLEEQLSEDGGEDD